MNFEKYLKQSIVISLAVIVLIAFVNFKEKQPSLDKQEQQNIAIFKQNKKSVVFISVHRRVHDYWRRSTYDIPRGSGSGFIWNKKGYIVTNYHVIEHANKAIVTLSNGEKYPAKLIGTAPDYDIAVLKIDGNKGKLSPVTIGSSSHLQVGQSVYAIGNPFGLEWTMTKGIISALDRSMDVNQGMAINHMIQTDASINPGNSGGPLLDSKGQVIGVNNMILSPSGASAGIGFSIPINTVKRVVASIIKTGKYHRPTIGIQVDRRLNLHYKQLYKRGGVVIADVIDNTSAQKANLRPITLDYWGNIVYKDVIIGIDHYSIKNLEDLFSALDNYISGEKITLKIWRDGKTVEIPITLH